MHACAGGQPHAVRVSPCTQHACMIAHIACRRLCLRSSREYLMKSAFSTRIRMVARKPVSSSTVTHELMIENQWICAHVRGTHTSVDAGVAGREGLALHATGKVRCPAPMCHKGLAAPRC